MVKKLEQKVWLNEFSHDGELTNQGFALAADTGLLIARSLLRSAPNLKWSILKKPKGHVAFNLPILKGFIKVDLLEPVGGAIAEMQGIIAERRNVGIYLEMFDYWLRNVKKPID